jgi:hypothetical protein
MSPLHLAAGEKPTPLAARSLPAVSKPTGETLNKWLAGKDLVEVCFAGPHLEPQKLKNSLQTKGLDNELDETFLLTPGEGGGDNRSFITVVMNVSNENVQRLLLLQRELGAPAIRWTLRIRRSGLFGPLQRAVGKSRSWCQSSYERSQPKSRKQCLDIMVV